MNLTVPTASPPKPAKPSPAIEFVQLSTHVMAGDLRPWMTNRVHPGADLIAGWNACAEPVHLGIVSGRILRFGGPLLVWSIPLGDAIIGAGKRRGETTPEDIVCDRAKEGGPVRYSRALGAKITPLTAKQAVAHIRKRIPCPLPADVERVAAEHAARLPEGPIDGMTRRTKRAEPTKRGKR